MKIQIQFTEDDIKCALLLLLEKMYSIDVENLNTFSLQIETQAENTNSWQNAEVRAFMYLADPAKKD
jgi:hypothetical protein